MKPRREFVRPKCGLVGRRLTILSVIVVYISGSLPTWAQAPPREYIYLGDRVLAIGRQAAAPGPVISVNPTGLAFSNVSTSFTLDRSVTVSNTGGGTLTGSATVSGTGFALAPGSPSSYSLTTGQQVTVTVRFSPTSAAAYSGTLTLTGGGGATVALSGTGVSGPGLSVSTTTAVIGQTITVNVTGGPALPRDWVGLHLASAVDTVYVSWKYLNGTTTPPASGVASAALTFTMPTTAGTYNFRFFRDNTFTKLATSASVVVAASAASLSVSATSVNPGQVVQVTVQGGPGNTSDWVGLHLTSAADTVFVDWNYLSGTRTQPPAGVTSAVLTFAMPATPGTYNFRFFQSGGYTKLATSATVTVNGPSLAVNLTTVAPGGTVQVTVANGPGNPSDWVGLHLASAADTAYLDWKYLNGTRTLPTTGVTSAVLTFTMPTTLGTYNFRFFQGGGSTKLATSPTVTVQ